MSKDIDETIQEAEETIASLENIANQQMDNAEQKIKKGIVQTFIWIAVTVIVYFIWGTTWFFWIFLAFNILNIAGIIFAKIMMAKAYKKIEESDNSDEDELNIK